VKHAAAIAWALLMGLAFAAPAAAMTVMPQKLTCPIDGESFIFEAVASYTTFGERPDGKPYGFLASFPMAECPTSHLVLYRDFNDAEISRLKVIVASPEYRAMAKDDAPHHRAAWLARKLGDAPVEIARLALVATWEADFSPVQATYLREVIDAVGQVAPEATSNSWLVLKARAINAERELGQFDVALKDIAALEETAQRTAPKAADQNDNAARLQKDRQSTITYLEDLKRVVLRRDDSLEPLDMIPSGVRGDRCEALGAWRKHAKPEGICDRKPG
jgi:hypothetical protein